jgi:hypothetical protein
MSDRGWNRSFDQRIPLPKGDHLASLADAGAYITKLPKGEHEAEEWQAATEALLLVATLGGPTAFARIAVMRALNRKTEITFTGRKARNWAAEIAHCLFQSRPLTRTAPPSRILPGGAVLGPDNAIPRQPTVRRKRAKSQ